jgi:hypothetical protein
MLPKGTHDAFKQEELSQTGFNGACSIGLEGMQSHSDPDSSGQRNVERRGTHQMQF